jgi:hypothetical protein
MCKTMLIDSKYVQKYEYTFVYTLKQGKFPPNERYSMNKIKPAL